MNDERVTVKASEQKRNKTWSVDDEHLRRTSNYIRHSLKGRLLYRLMLILMGVESVIWTLMDMTRSLRMRVAERITKHKHNDRV